MKEPDIRKVAIAAWFSCAIVAAAVGWWLYHDYTYSVCNTGTLTGEPLACR